MNQGGRGLCFKIERIPPIDFWSKPVQIKKPPAQEKESRIVAYQEVSPLLPKHIEVQKDI